MLPLHMRRAGRAFRDTAVVGRPCASVCRRSQDFALSTREPHRPRTLITSPVSATQCLSHGFGHGGLYRRVANGHPDEDDRPIHSTEGYLKQTLDFAGEEVRRRPAVDARSTIFQNPSFRGCGASACVNTLNPGGQVLALFHTRRQPEESAHCRFQVTNCDTVVIQLAQPFPIKGVFTNRSIQDLFNQWSGFRQFLAKDSISEVIITR